MLAVTRIDPHRSGMTDPKAPIAATHPHHFEHHGIRIDDPWAWLKDAGYPNVTDEAILSYLKEENAFFESAMAPHKGLIDTIFEEMKGRVKQDDASVPQKDGDYLYWWAYETGGQYPKWWRRPVAGGADQLILDEPREAEGKDYFRVGAVSISPDGRLMAWSADDNGAERYVLRIRDLATGADIETVTLVSNGGVAWSANQTRWLTPRLTTIGAATAPCCTGWGAIRPGPGCCTRKPTKAFASRSAARATRIGSRSRPATTRPARFGWCRPPIRPPSRS